MFPTPSQHAREIAPGTFVMRAFTPAEAAAIVRQAERSPAWCPAGINADRVVDATVRDAEVLYEELHRPHAAVYRERLALMTERVARVAAPDAALAEVQLVRYRTGGRYVDHRDSPAPEATARRLALVCYLDESCGGGETVFPEIGLRIPPVSGLVLMFPPTALHRAEPVVTGTKHVVTAWFHHPQKEECSVDA